MADQATLEARLLLVEDAYQSGQSEVRDRDQSVKYSREEMPAIIADLNRQIAVFKGEVAAGPRRMRAVFSG